MTETHISPVIDGAMIPISRVYTPETDVNCEKKYICYQGAKDVSYQNTRANSFTTSQASWTVYVPSLRTVVDRRMYMKYSVTLTITNNAAPITVLGGLASSFGIRAYPLHSASSSVTVDLGGAKMAWNARQQVHALSYLNMSEFSRRKFGGVAMPDQYGAALTNGARNPFAPYQTNELEDTRSSYNHLVQMRTYTLAGAAINTYYISPDDPYQTWTFPAGQNVQIVQLVYQIYEPFFLSPFVIDSDVHGLMGINQININFNITDLRLMFEGDTNPTPAMGAAYTMTVAAGNVPPVGAAAVGFDAMMLTCFYTLSPIYPTIAQNVYTVYDNQSITTLTSPITTVVSDNVANPIQNITTSYTTFRQHPRYIIIYARPNDNFELDTNAGSETFYRFNTFLRIMNVNITYNNKTGLLSNADEFNLYMMSVKNGLNMSWSQWRGNTGSVFVCTPLDLGIDDESIGCKGAYSFQCTLTLQRPLSSRAELNEPAGGVAFEINVIPVYDQILYSGLDGQLQSRRWKYNNEQDSKCTYRAWKFP